MKKKLFNLKPNSIELFKNAEPGNYFDKVGRRSAILGHENGSFEFWCYPVKVCRNFSLSFLLNNSTVPIESSAIVKSISVSPEITIITYCYQSFTIKELFITPINKPGSIILLDVETIEPLKIISSFLPELQPMWPAAVGGQYCAWDKNVNAFLLSESRKKINAFIGSPNGKNISYTPAHMFSDSPNQFIIEVNPFNTKDELFIIALAGGIMDREEAKKIYNDLISDPQEYYNDCFKHYLKFREEMTTIQTPDEKINLAFEWGKIAFDNMIVDNPHLGEGMVAGLGCAGKSGRPGFGWFFGGDAFLNSFAMLGYGAFDTVKGSLKFVQQFQREDGKIAHEVSQSAKIVDWFGDYPYAYIHADTTCFYLISMYEYLISSGDIAFIKESWQSIINAYKWCISTDEDKDGLMDNSKAGLGAFEIPPFTKIRTDIYLSASYVMALFGMCKMAEVIDLSNIEFCDRYDKALNQINNKFWDPEEEYFAFAFDNDGKMISERTSLCAVPMIWRIIDDKKALKALEKINSSELQTDWGTRSMSSKSKFYDPLNYNYGAVWPYMTTFSILANYKYYFSLQGFTILKSTIEHVFDNAIGYCHEVFSGNTNKHLEESVPHQAFSTLGYMLPLIKGTLGLSGDAIKKEIIFSPQLPAHWDFLKINNYKIGNSSFDFFLERAVNLSKNDTINKSEVLGIHFKNNGEENYRLSSKISFPLETKILNVSINNQKYDFTIEQTERNIFVNLIIDKLNAGVIIIEYEQIFEIIPYVNDNEIGATTKGLRILKDNNNKTKRILLVEGLSGKKYILGIMNSDLITDLEGAELINDGLLIDFPDLEIEEYIKKEVIIYS